MIARKERLAGVLEALRPVSGTGVRIGARQVLKEWESLDPVFAAEGRRHRREMKAWRAGRKALAAELQRLQVPLVVTSLGEDEARSDAACAILRACDWLFDRDAPGDLMRDLLAASGKVLGP